MNTKRAALTVLSIALKIVIIAVVILGITRLGGMAFDYGHSVFQEEAVDEEPGRSITITVEDGSAISDIAKLMEDKGLVNDWKLFYIQVKVSKYAKKLEEGTYTLTTAMKPREMMAVMAGDDQEEEEEKEEEKREEEEEKKEEEE